METIVEALSELHLQVENQPLGTKSSVEKVLSHDDLLTEILVRLPVISLVPFKSVCKQWLFLIKSTNFIELHRNKNPNLDPPSCCFLQLHSFSAQYVLVLLHAANRSPLHTIFPFGSENEGSVQIMHSCNGLLLCFILPNKLFVYNPSTNQFKLLSQGRYSKLTRIIGVKLAFDPTKSHHYKVIYAGAIFDSGDHSIQIKTYSSETGDWNDYPRRFPSCDFADFKNGIYWNGAIHWLDRENEDLHYKLDVNSLFLTTIKEPPNVNGKIYYDHKLFESRGCLLHACVVYTHSTRFQQLNVYEMRNEGSEWSVRYVINIDDITTSVPKTWEIVLREREEESFLVLGVSGKIVQYNIVLKTLCKIYDLSPPAICLECFPFTPSFVGV